MIDIKQESDKDKKKNLKRDRLFTAIRLIVSISLFSFLVYRNYSVVPEMFVIIKSLNPVFLILSVLAFIFGIFLQMHRWNTLLNAQGIFISKNFLMQTYYIGFFYSNIFPTNIGGDIYRGYNICIQKKIPAAKSLAAIIVERFIALVCGTIYIMASFFMIYKYLDYRTLLSIAVLPALGILLIFIFIKPELLGINKLFKTRLLKKYEDRFHDFQKSFKLYSSKIKSLIISFVFGLFSQLIFILSYYFIGLYLEMNISFSSFFFLNPIIVLSANIPISVGGIGVRENVAVLLLQKFGVSGEKSFIFSIIVLFIILLNTAAGGLIYVMRNIILKVKEKKLPG